jgi:hypothetical protein
MTVDPKMIETVRNFCPEFVAELEDLRKKNADFIEYHHQLVQMTQSNIRSERDLRQSQKDNSALTNDVLALRQELKAERFGREQDLAEEKSEMGRLRDSVKTLTGKAEKTAQLNRENVQEIDRLKREVAELQASGKALQLRVENAQLSVDKAKTDLEAMSHSREQERQGAERRIKQAESSAAQNVSIANDMRRENAKLRDELTKVSRQGASNGISGYDRQIASNRELDQARTALIQERSEVGRLKEKQRIQGDTIARLTGQMVALRSELDKERGTVPREELERQILVLQAAIRERS